MTQEELFERAHELIGRFDNIKFVGPGWSGNVRQGFQFNPELVASSGAGSPTGGSGGPPTPTGACCFTNGSCSVYTSVYCSIVGGTYQGNGTICSPNPCPQPTGACCRLDGTCSVGHPADCDGTYEGDGTNCSTNPCALPCCGFGTFDGSPGTFRTRTETVTVSGTSDCSTGHTIASCSGSVTRTESVNHACTHVCQSSGGSVTCLSCPGHLPTSCSTTGSGCSLDYFSCGGTCTDNPTVVSSHTRTTQHIVEMWSGPHCSMTITFDTIVSDECPP